MLTKPIPANPDLEIAFHFTKTFFSIHIFNNCVAIQKQNIFFIGKLQNDHQFARIAKGDW